MRKKICVLTCIVMFCSLGILKAQQSADHKVRTLVNLLDYIGKDYPNAVKDGAIINESEYSEMKEFSSRIKQLQKDIDKNLDDETFSALSEDIKQLQSSVDDKASQQKIASISSNVQQQVLSLNLITVTPSSWPDIKKGKKLYQANCTSCHGAEGFGDGQLAKNLDPPPSNFHDDALAANLSPLQAYNTVRLGIKGTSMRSFQKLTDEEVWDIAFYVNKMNYDKDLESDKSGQLNKTLKDTVTLSNVTTMKNKQWLSFMDEQDIDQEAGMSALRSISSFMHERQNNPLAKAVSLLADSKEAYSSDDVEKARQLALSAYLQGVEPVESQIQASGSGLVTKVENKMIDVRSAISGEESKEVVNEKIEAATLTIQEAQNALDGQSYSFWFTFLMAGSILLREGLEAMLIIMVIVGVLKRMDAHKSLKYVHAGWLTALGIGIISWFFVSSLIQMSAFHREFMEGLGSLIAVAMLLYIGFWLHNKTHASQWTKFVKERINNLVSDSNRWGLAFLAFVVVFREAFESIIFLSSISIKSSAAGNSGIMLGSVSAIGVVIVLAAVAIKYSMKLPIKSLFKWSSFAMSVLAVILVGKGIHAFQEAGYLSVNNLPHLPHLPLLGLYPSLLTVAAQISIVAAIFGLYKLSERLSIASSSKA